MQRDSEWYCPTQSSKLIWLFTSFDVRESRQSWHCEVFYHFWTPLIVMSAEYASSAMLFHISLSYCNNTYNHLRRHRFWRARLHTKRTDYVERVRFARNPSAMEKVSSTKHFVRIILSTLHSVVSVPTPTPYSSWHQQMLPPLPHSIEIILYFSVLSRNNIM